MGTVKGMHWLLLAAVWLLVAGTSVLGGVPPSGGHGHGHTLGEGSPGHHSHQHQQHAAVSSQDYVDSGLVMGEDAWTSNKRDSQQASQLMLRSPRSSRQYDVPQIGESLKYYHKIYFIISDLSLFLFYKYSEF